MTLFNDDADRIAELFDQAQSINPPELAAWLDQQNLTLDQRQELAEMLETNEVIGPVSDELVEQEPDPISFNETWNEPPSRLGVRYCLGSLLGQGGMGDVYLAEDAELGRKVALKLIRPALRGSKSSVDRFTNEAKLLAELQHPNIPPLHDFGRSEHGLYIVLKKVQGETLADLFKELKDSPDRVSKLLPLFQSVCEGVAYAHGKGICHYDLKPGNVMVGEHGEVQVMDWGLAKANGGVASNQTGVDQQATNISFLHTKSLGTPGYSSPEQVRGKAAGEHSDVFMLGSMLCEILTGEPAFRGNVDKRIQLTKQGDLSDAHDRLKAVKGFEELVQLTTQCLDINLEQRPRNASEVAKVIQNYRSQVEKRLEQEKIDRAKAETQVVEAAKRRKVTLGLFVAATMALILVGVIGLAYQSSTAALRVAVSEAERSVQVAINDLNSQLETWQKAADAWHKAQGLSGGFVSPWWRASIQSKVKDAEQNLALVEELERIRIPKQELLDRTKSNVFDHDRISKDYRTTLKKFGIDPLQDDLEKTARRIKDSPVREQLLMALDDWAILAKEASTRKQLWILANKIDEDKQRQLWRKAVLDGCSDDLVAETQRFSQKGSFQGPTRHLLLIRMLIFLDKSDVAEALLQKANASFPDDFWILVEAGTHAHFAKKPKLDQAVRYWTAALARRPRSPELFGMLGEALFGQGMLDEAVVSHRKAIELKSDYAEAYSGLGNTLHKQKNFDEAVASHRKAIQLKPNDAAAYSNLGNALADQGKLDEAVASHRKAIELKPDLVEAHSNLGVALSHQGKLDEAVASFRKAIELNPDLVEAHDNLGNVLADQGKLDEAVASFRKAIELKPDYTKAYNNLGVVLVDQGKLDEAAANYRKAIEHKPDYAEAYHSLGVVLIDQGKLDEAAANFRKAIELKPDYAEAHFNLGVVLSDQGKLDEAAASHRKTIELKPDYMEAHFNLGAVLMDQGKLDEAVASYRKAIELEPNDAEAYCNLGNTLGKQKKWDEAVASHRKAIELKPDYAEAYHDLGVTLQSQGRFVEAKVALKRGYELGSKQPDWPYPSAELLKACERLIELEKEVLVVLGNKTKLLSNSEYLEYADLCYQTQRFSGGVWLISEHVTKNPQSAEDRSASHRYNGACCAILAASGKSRNEPLPTDAEKVRLRTQALTWLQAEMTAWTKAKVEHSYSFSRISKSLQQWIENSDLATVRDPEALTKLPESERKAWESLWKEVDQLLKETTPKP